MKKRTPLLMILCFGGTFWVSADAAGPLAIVIPYFLIGGDVFSFHMLGSLLGFVGVMVGIQTVWTRTRKELVISSLLLCASAVCFVAISRPVLFSAISSLPLIILTSISLRRSSVEA
jgi:hypothetical protein